MRRAPEQRFDSRKQLDHLERFRQIVVGTELQAKHFIYRLALCRQHQNRSFNSLLPKIATNVVTVLLRQHDIEHDQIVLTGKGLLESGLSICSDVNVKAFASKSIRKRQYKL